jgi:hypothetical protein
MLQYGMRTSAKNVRDWYWRINHSRSSRWCVRRRVQPSSTDYKCITNHSQTSDQRIHFIDSVSNGFIYMVSVLLVRNLDLAATKKRISNGFPNEPK